MTLDIKQLERILPHRAPILMLERVIDLVPRQSGTGIRRFAAGDSVFAGHFPGLQILPGIYIIEALAQTAAAISLFREGEPSPEPAIGVLAKVNEMAFYARISPNDEVEFRVEIERIVGPFVFARGEALVGNTRCAAGKLTLRPGIETGGEQLTDSTRESSAIELQ